MAYLTTIDNPFDPYNCKTVEKIESGEPIYLSISGFNCFFDVAVSVNGQIIEDYNYIVKEEDHVGFLAIPHGGGGDKNPFATVALVALTIAAPYAGAFAGLAFSSTIVASVVTAGVMIGGGMLINSLLPPPTPDFGGGIGGGLEDSPTYSWAQTQNPTNEGTALPIVYGKAKITPLVISQYVEVYGDKQYLNILYALNDGAIASVTDIKINDNPITYYDSMTYDVRLGSNSQTLIPSFDNTRIDNGVGAKLSTTETVRTTSNNAVTGLSIVIAANGGLYYANNAGGLDSRTVALEIKYRPIGGAWVTIPSTSISGSTTSTIREVFSVNDLPPNTYEISARRTVVEDTSVRTHESVYFEVFTEIIYDDFTYPNTALLAIRALATDQLSGNTPKVSCVVDRGSGLDNPALAAKNIIQLIGGEVNATKFAEWETYCNTEGFRCNLVFDSTSNVRDALNAISTLGRASIVPIGSEYIPIIDKVESLATQRFMFNMGNIIKDSFEENYLPLADRTNVVSVTYFDENLDYERQSIEVYQNGFDESIDTARRAAVTLYGCTDRSQAIRHARFLLNKNRYLTNTVSFDADIDAIACTIGDVIDVAHDVPQWGYSGRILDTNAPLNADFWVFEAGVYVDGVFIDSDNTTSIETGIKLDRELTLEAGVTYYFTVKYNSDDTRETVEIMSPVTVTTDTFAEIEGLSKAPEDMMLYSFGMPNTEVKQFKVSSITRSNEQRRRITAIEYIPEVYADTGDSIPVINSSSLADVTSLQASNYYRTNIKGLSENIVDLTWIGTGIGWSIYSRLQGDTDWTFEGYTTKTSYQLVGVPAGNYEYRVGDKIASTSVSVLPDAPSITNAVASPRYTGVQFSLTYADFPEFSHIEAWEATLAQTIDDAVLIGTTDNSIYQRYGLPVSASNNYWFRIVDVYGNKGLFFGAVVGTTTTDTSAILLDLKAQQGNPEYLPALSDILITGNIAGVPSLGLTGDLFIDGSVTSDAMATNVLIVGGEIESANYSWNAGVPIGFGMWSEGDTDSGASYNIIGGKFYGAEIVSIESRSANYSWNAGTPVGFGMWSDGDTDSGQSYNIIGASIYGGEVTGGKMTGGEVVSPTYSWNAGSPIGFGLWTEGETSSGQSYNIVGSSIYGGSLEGASLKGNTLDIQDINLKDTAGTTTASSFYGKAGITYDSGTYTVTVTTGIITTGNAPFNLLANNGYVSFGHSITGPYPYRAGWTWLCSTDVSSVSVRVYYGTGSTYRSLTLNATTETINGWEFGRIDDDTVGGKRYHYYIKNNIVPEDICSDADGFVITLDSSGVMDTPVGTNSMVFMEWLVSNM